VVIARDNISGSGDLSCFEEFIDVGVQDNLHLSTRMENLIHQCLALFFRESGKVQSSVARHWWMRFSIQVPR